MTDDDEDFVAYVTGRQPGAAPGGGAARGRPASRRRPGAAGDHPPVHPLAAGGADREPRRVRVQDPAARVSRRAPAAVGDVRLGVEHSEVDLAAPAPDIEQRMLLRDALATLPPKQRAVVVLRFIADRSVDEVAEILGIATGTVKSPRPTTG